MKKILCLALSIILLLGCVCTLASCGKKAKIVGTYEMVSIEGTVTYNGVTTKLDEDLYEYYRIILNEDGTAVVEAKAKNNTTKIEQEGEWEYKNGVIKLKSSPMGVTVVEELQWDDGIITYEATQNAQGMNISMKIKLEKQ